jgi:hypothetical protein
MDAVCARRLHGCFLGGFRCLPTDLRLPLLSMRAGMSSDSAVSIPSHCGRDSTGHFTGPGSPHSIGDNETIGFLCELRRLVLPEVRQQGLLRPHATKDSKMVLVVRANQADVRLCATLRGDEEGTKNSAAKP